ncbi:hypothetical protein C1145_17375, partial [Clostridium botulinum]
MLFCRKNSTLAVLDKIKGKFACIDKKKEKLIAEKQIEKLSIKVQNKDQKVKLLSRWKPTKDCSW